MFASDVVHPTHIRVVNAKGPYIATNVEVNTTQQPYMLPQIINHLLHPYRIMAGSYALPDHGMAGSYAHPDHRMAGRQGAHLAPMIQYMYSQVVWKSARTLQK